MSEPTPPANPFDERLRDWSSTVVFEKVDEIWTARIDMPSGETLVGTGHTTRAARLALNEQLVQWVGRQL